MKYRVEQAVAQYADYAVGDVIDVPRDIIGEREGWVVPVSIIVDVDKPEPATPAVKVRVLDVITKVAD